MKSIYKSNRTSQTKRRYLLVALASILAVAGIALLLTRNSPVKDTNSHSTVPPASIQEPGYESVHGRYMFSGTVVMARAVERDARRQDGSYDYSQPFSQFTTFQPEQYDGWLIDLECPVTTDRIPYEQQISNLVFNCHPDWLPEMRKYFNMVNLANNHSSDKGAAGFSETLQHLEEAGIHAFGHYDPSKKENSCKVIALPVRLRGGNDAMQRGHLPIAFCAWHYFGSTPKPGELEIMERYKEVMPVFSFIHVGAEYYLSADSNQVDIARKLIDLGSEFVVGNSPHWVQNTEVYKGKLIAYSTGNFIFDQIDEETRRGMSIDLEIALDYDDTVSAWLELGEKCLAQKDDCLEQAVALNLSKLRLDLEFKPVASIGGARAVTRRAEPSLQQAVEQRMNWEQTLRELTAVGSP